MNNLSQLAPLVPLALVFIVAQILFFIAAREFFCWYWKVNRVAGELTLIREALQRMEQQRTAVPAVQNEPGLGLHG